MLLTLDVSAGSLPFWGLGAVYGGGSVKLLEMNIDYFMLLTLDVSAGGLPFWGLAAVYGGGGSVQLLGPDSDTTQNIIRVTD
jgi:hypothetical protein